MNRLLCLAASLAALFVIAPARAQVRLSGSFTASQACPALQAIRQQTNPGNVMLEPGHVYRVIGKNRPDATFFQIVVDGAQPSQRWVAVECGQIGLAPEGTGAAAGGANATHVLALGWEPAFCRQHRDKAECARETSQTGDANGLSLHGLWPQPRGKAYCNVAPRLVQTDKAHDWASLPEPEISPATRERLSQVMPGVQSGLQRHEWIVHGTCFGAPADAYFNRAASLAEQVNASPVRHLFVQSIGQTLSADAIRSAFDQAFGPGAGTRVTVSCSGQGTSRHITELVISLAGDVNGSAPMGALIQAASPVTPGCPSGAVDRAPR